LGCGAQLVEYHRHHPGPEAASLAARSVDIARFLTRERALDGRHIAPLPARIGVHTPCSLRNVMRSDRDAIELLRLIPEAEVIELPGNALCCGSAGAYMLTQPEMADALRRPKLDAAQDLKIDVLATSNIGCALHFKAGLGRATPIEVAHPVTLLERQLRDAP
jgi:glycolate oxidase iron-sulfur subunit